VKDTDAEEVQRSPLVSVLGDSLAASYFNAASIKKLFLFASTEIEHIIQINQMLRVTRLHPGVCVFMSVLNGWRCARERSAGQDAGPQPL